MGYSASIIMTALVVVTTSVVTADSEHQYICVQVQVVIVSPVN